MPPVSPPQRITTEEQLARWVAGESIHMSDPDQCCPDFSCCKPELLAEKSVREAFATASEQDRFGFLMNFLGGLITNDPELSKKDIKIIGQDPTGAS